MAIRGNPTKAEKKWMDFLSQHGCVICRSPTEIHHLLSGGRRIGHMDSISLCPWHHRSGFNDSVVTSRHPWKRAFEKRYGTEDQLLKLLRRLYEEQHLQ